MDAAGARSAIARGVPDGAAIRCWAPVIGGEDEAEIRRIGAEIGLSPRWPSKCISRKQKAAGHVQPPISCVASCDAQGQNYFFFFAFFFFAFFAIVELLC
jgi:hypothetical protein